MARYKQIDTSPRFLAVDLEAQLLPGTFEHALNHLLDHEIDLSAFDARFKNDDTGASAFPPAMLLKVVLLAYSRGVISSRDIERLCRDHVTFIALSGDSCPHFTTTLIAAFISGLGDLIGQVFKQVLLVCDAQGLIGREMFANGLTEAASSCPPTQANNAAAHGLTSSTKPTRWKPPCRLCSSATARLMVLTAPKVPTNPNHHCAPKKPGASRNFKPKPAAFAPG